MLDHVICVRFFLKKLLILFILAVPSPRCVVSFSLVAVSRGFSRVVMPGLLAALPSLVVEHGLGHTVFSSCDLWAH